MKLTEKQKLILAILLFAVSGYVLYSSFFSSSSSNAASASSDTTSVTADEQQGQDILDLADKLNNISINSKVFESPVFRGLVDFDVPLSPELQGRPNPFAPIGNDSGI